MTKQPEQPRRGRGALPSTLRSRRYGKAIELAMSPDEYAAFAARAEAEGYDSFSAWIRDQARAAVGLPKDGKK